MLPRLMYYNPSDPLPTLPQNVSSPNIKRVTSYEVHVHVQKFNKLYKYSLMPLYVIFDDFGER